MKVRMKLILVPLAAAVIGSLVLYGCGSGGSGGDAGAAVAGTEVTVATTTTTTVAAGITLSFATTPASPFDSRAGVGVNDVSGAVNYAGAPIEFGPYTIGGVGTATAVSLPINAGLQTYTTFSINGGAFGTAGALSNGNTLSVRFDLASYISGVSGLLAYGTALQPKVGIGTPTVTFSILTCADPALPPSVGNTNCK